MTSKKVSELNSATELAPDDLVLVVDVTAGESKKATLAQFAAATTAAVTSVDASAAGTGLTFSGGPVTGVGTLTLDGTLNVEHGGTGANSLTGYVKGVGITPLTAVSAIPGSDVTGDISGSAANVTGVVAIANGGTGEHTKEAAFDALAPTTDRGDLILHNGTSNVRFGVGTDGQVLTADPTNDGDGLAWNWLNVATSVIGVLPVANGGTGVSDIPLGSLLVGAGPGDEGPNPVNFVAPGTAGEVLTSTGDGWVSAAPSGGGTGGVAAVLVSPPITISGPAVTPTIGLIPGVNEGDVLKWTSGAWAPGSAGAGSGVSSVTATSPLKHTGTSNVVIELFDPVPVNKGGTGTGTAFTPGSVVFAGTGGVYAQDNTKLFWDNTAKRLGIGANSSLVATLDVRGTVHAHTPSDSTTAYQFLKASGAAVLSIDTSSTTGRVGVNTGSPSRALHVVGTSLFTSNVNSAETSTFENTNNGASASSTVAVTAGGVLAARISAFSLGATGSSLGTALTGVVGVFADTAAMQLQIAAKGAATSIVIGTASDTKTYPQMTFAADGGAVTVNNGQNAAVNFVVKGSSAANLLNINATTNSVAINSTGVTGVMLTVFGSVLARTDNSNALRIQNNASENVVTVDTVNKRLGIAVMGAVDAALSVANAFNVNSGGIITKYGNATPSNGNVLVWSGTGFQTKTITGTGTVTVSYDAGTGNLVVNGSSGGGGTTTAAGSTKEVQYNGGGGAFAANVNFTYDASTSVLRSPNVYTSVIATDASTSTASGITIQPGSSVISAASLNLNGGNSTAISGTGGGVSISAGYRNIPGSNLGAVSISGGTVGVQATGALSLGTTAATSVGIGRSGITTTITGALTQNTGAFSLTGTATSTLTTTGTASLNLQSANNLSVQATGDIEIGTGSGAGVQIGFPGVITDIQGPLNKPASGGAFTLAANANSSLSTTAGNITITPAATLNLGTATTTSVSIASASVVTAVNGTLGVGISAPDARLHAHAGSAGVIAAATNAVVVAENSANCYFNALAPAASEAGVLFGFTGSSAQQGGVVYGGPSVGALANKLQFKTAATTRMVVDGSGNVGIGITSPTNRLEVSGGFQQTGGAVNMIANSASLFKTTSGNLTLQTDAVGAALNLNAQGAINLSAPLAPVNVTAGTTLGIQAGGTTQISTTSSTMTLSSPGAISLISTGAQAYIEASSTASVIFRTAGGGAERMRLTGTGRVGIGTSAPTQTLDIAGTLRVQTLAPGANPAVGRSAASGDITLLTSDQRFKKDVRGIPGALDTLVQMRGVRFKWDHTFDPEFLIDEDQKEKDQIGFIAQEVEQHYPELVYANGFKDYKAVRYPEVTAVLLEALKELNAKVVALQAEVLVLKGQS